MLCDGTNPVTASSLGQISRYGGPILYLFVYGFALFGVLVWVDSGAILSRRNAALRQAANTSNLGITPADDIANEVAAVTKSSDILRVLGVEKSFGDNKVVDKVSFGVSQDTVFALLGPNGAGKTSTFNIIRA